MGTKTKTIFLSTALLGCGCILFIFFPEKFKLSKKQPQVNSTPSSNLEVRSQQEISEPSVEQDEESAPFDDVPLEFSPRSRHQAPKEHIISHAQHEFKSLKERSPFGDAPPKPAPKLQQQAQKSSPVPVLKKTNPKLGFTGYLKIGDHSYFSIYDNTQKDSTHTVLELNEKSSLGYTLGKFNVDELSLEIKNGIDSNICKIGEEEKKVSNLSQNTNTSSKNTSYSQKNESSYKPYSSSYGYDNKSSYLDDYDDDWDDWDD